MSKVTRINSDIIKAYSVHIYTTMGIVCGIFAVRALFENNLEIVFLWLEAALFIDGTDGLFARKYQVTKFAPRINGVILDAIVDFFNYVILPVLIILQVGFLSDQIEFLLVILILCASCYTFSNTKQKTKDNYFDGFPAIWNVLVLDFYIMNTSQTVNFIAIVFCVVLTFVLVAIFIPIFPAKAEKKAPIMNAITIIQCVEGTMVDTTNNKTLTPTTNIDNSLYSAFKNAKAPS